jgi:hypothetical protein
MSIIYNSSRFVGSKVSVIETEGFIATVSTFREGTVNGLNTVVWEGRSELSPMANISYEPYMDSEAGRKFHDLFVETMNTFGDIGKSLKEAVELSVVDYEGMVKEVQYQI